MIRYKKNVNPIGLRAPILRAQALIDPVFAAEGVDTITTSTTGDNHAKYSAHWRGDAIDLRSRHLKPERRNRVLAAIKNALGPDFMVLLERPESRYNQHYHIEWKPLKPEET